MDAKKELRTSKAAAPAGAYSQGVEIGNMVFTAGQGGKNLETGKFPPSVEEQTRQALENIRAILAEANASVGEIVKATVHLRDRDDFGGFNEAYKKFFDEYAPGVPLPVRTTVQSGLGEMLVEIDVIAVKTR